MTPLVTSTLAAARLASQGEARRPQDRQGSPALAEMFNYVSKLRGMTKGRANYSMKLARHEPVPMNIQKELLGGQGLQG